MIGIIHRLLFVFNNEVGVSSDVHAVLMELVERVIHRAAANYIMTCLEYKNDKYRFRSQEVFDICWSRIMLFILQDAMNVE